nr:MAG TPA: hypothetical protein [Caudoviricetes sp.]
MSRNSCKNHTDRVNIQCLSGCAGPGNIHRYVLGSVLWRDYRLNRKPIQSKTS